VNKKITAAVLAVTLGGCADVDMGNMNREEMLGTAAGAAVGGILGFQLGGGLLLNSTFAALGTIGGGAAGFYTTQKGLKESSDGQVVDWHNPETGNSGIFRPSRSFNLGDGRYCRQYRTTVSFDKSVHSGDGMACRNADGQWEVVSDDFS